MRVVGESLLLLLALNARACVSSIALLTKTEDSIYYFKLSAEEEDEHSYIGNMPLTDTASGAAIQKRHIVMTEEFRTRYANGCSFFWLLSTIETLQI